MIQDTGSGLRALDNAIKRLGLEDNVAGPLYKLFEVPKAKYKTAVEVTAGASLFHVVVDTDGTATKLVDLMNKERTGRLTFIPLNRIKPKPTVYPEADDAIPLLKEIRYDEERHGKAFEQVFGRTCVCEDLSVGAAYTRSHNISAVTVLGDRVDRKGALTGGYNASGKSRLDAIKAVKTWATRYDEDAKRLSDVKAGLLALEQKITKVAGEMQVLNTRREQAQHSRDPLNHESMILNRERDALGERILKMEANLADMEAEASGLKARRDALKAELAAPMVKTLSDSEVQEMEELAREVDQLKKSLIDLSAAKNEVRATS